MEIIFLIGRIIFGGYFIRNAFNHFLNHAALEGYTASKGVSMPALAVFVTGVLLLVGGIGVLLGIFIEWALLSLVLFLIPVSFIMHAFWKVSDPMAKSAEQINFMKNMALLGAVFIMFAIPTPWPYSFSL